MFRKSSVIVKLFDSKINFAFKRNFKFARGDVLQPNQMCGLYYVKDNRLNKGLGFTLAERQHLMIQGLLPPRTRLQEEQVKLCLYHFSHYKSPLDRYLYLSDLHERNVKLHFKLMNEYIEEIMPVAYTPTVGTVCQRFGSLFRNPNGLYITYYDKGNIKHLLKNWPESQIRAICVTDGERILGLGDLGANGMGICIGKLALYTALAGVKPHLLLPIQLDIGTNNEALLNDPFYLGLRMKRIKLDEYEEFLDEFMDAVTNLYGANTLIHFEDFAFNNAIKFLHKYAPKYCVFNDDFQGTGAIGLAGLLSAACVLGTDLKNMKYLFVGAGGANLGIASLLVKALMEGGASCHEAFNLIYFKDLDGVVTTGRERYQPLLQCYAKDMEPVVELLDVIKTVRPNVLVGATAQPGLFTPEILKTMAEINERPVIFALSNPTSVSECTAEQAISNTEGRALFSSGSPMPPVEYNGKTIQTSQMNNAFIFPGVALGILLCKSYYCTEAMFVMAAKEVAKGLKAEDREMGGILPGLKQINEISIQIAMRICEYAFERGLAARYPEPKDLEEYVRSRLYKFEYQPVYSPKWEWPQLPKVNLKDESIASLPKY